MVQSEQTQYVDQRGGALCRSQRCRKDASMIGVMPSGATQPVAQASIIFKRCALGKMAFSMPPIGATRITSECTSTKPSLAVPVKKNGSPTFANTATATVIALGRSELR